MLAAGFADADVILGLEDSDFWQATHAQTPLNRTGMDVRTTTRPGAKLITISSSDLLSKSNYQDFGPYTEVDLAIAADAEASLPALIDACKRLVTGDRQRRFQERGAKFVEAAKRTAQDALDEAAWGWDASPITTARLSAELWNEIKKEDWSLVGNAIRNLWPHRLWDFKQSYQWNGFSGGYSTSPDADIQYCSVNCNTNLLAARHFWIYPSNRCSSSGEYVSRFIRNSWNSPGKSSMLASSDSNLRTAMSPGTKPISSFSAAISRSTCSQYPDAVSEITVPVLTSQTLLP